jgi:ethanolamine utilization protein EutN
MTLCRVEGHVTATKKHPSFQGWRLLVCQPIDADGRPEGGPIVALDSLGAGLHDQVVVSTDGSAARAAVGDPISPARMLIVAITDEGEKGIAR